MFKAVLIEKDAQPYRAGIQSLDAAQLPAGDVTVRVDYSTLNYKDALAITGKGPVVRQFPMVPGNDFAGTVESSNNASYKSGDKVLLNGWGVGEISLGRACAVGARQRRMADSAAARIHCAPGDGHRHRRLYGHAVRDGFAAPRHHAQTVGKSW